MKPILFDKTSNTFTTNGIGRLSDAISCKVTEQRNGQYELEMEYPETGLHASSIEMSSIIGVIPYDGGTLQPFRVYKITKPINGKYSVYAQHISYQLSHIPAMPFSITASASACNSTLQGLKSNAAETCPFTFWTDVTTVSSYTQTAPASIRSRLGGVDGSVLDQFGGEYEWDGYTVKLHDHRGVTTPTYTLRYGKNITDLNQEENIANVITGICPFWVDSEGGNIVTLPEKVVESAAASSYPYKRTVVYDFSGSFEEAPTEAQLRAKAQAYVNQSGIGIPDVSIKVSFVHLADTEEYKDIAPLQHVKLCDEIAIRFEELGIDTTAQVVKTVYNVLADRYDSIEIGTVRSDLATTISDTNNAIQGLANATQKNFGKLSNELQEDIDNATAWLTGDGGVIRALKNANDEWTDLLCMSTTATASSGNVLRLNTNGIGFSSTGWNGPFTQAWTLDGKLVIGGTNVPSITVYDNNNNIIFKADATAMVWNATNSSMSNTGVITATGANLTNATITGGEMKVTNSNGYFTRIGDGKIVFGKNSTDYGALSVGTKGIELNAGGYVIEDGHDVSIVGDDVYLYAGNGDIKLDTYSNQKVVIDTNRLDLLVNGINTGNGLGYTGTKTIGGVNLYFVNGICTG